MRGLTGNKENRCTEKFGDGKYIQYCKLNKDMFSTKTNSLKGFDEQD
jgi:hypothetical protein